MFVTWDCVIYIVRIDFEFCLTLVTHRSRLPTPKYLVPPRVEDARGLREIYVPQGYLLYVPLDWWNAVTKLTHGCDPFDDPQMTRASRGLAHHRHKKI